MKCGSAQGEIPRSDTITHPALLSTAVGLHFAGRNTLLAQMLRNICADDRHKVGWGTEGEQDWRDWEMAEVNHFRKQSPSNLYNWSAHAGLAKLSS